LSRTIAFPNSSKTVRTESSDDVAHISCSRVPLISEIGIRRAGS
jgi:hypothetical protein